MLAIILLAVFGVAEIGDEMLVKKKKSQQPAKTVFAQQSSNSRIIHVTATGLCNPRFSSWILKLLAVIHTDRLYI